MAAALLVLSVLVLYNAIYLALQILTAHGVRMEEIALGFGPALVERVDGRGRTWRLRVFPTGATVRFDAEAWERLPAGRRAIVLATPHGLMLAIALALGGGVDGMDAARSFLRGTLHPIDAGAPLLHVFAARLAAEPLVAAVDGVVVLAVLNLLPVYRLTAGGMLLAMALPPGGPASRAGRLVTALGLVAIAVVWLAWSVAWAALLVTPG